jgi:hypothetical protein
MHKRFTYSGQKELRSSRQVQYLNNTCSRSHGQNLSSTSGQPEFVFSAIKRFDALVNKNSLKIEVHFDGPSHLSTEVHSLKLLPVGDLCECKLNEIKSKSLQIPNEGCCSQQFASLLHEF